MRALASNTASPQGEGVEVFIGVVSAFQILGED